MEASKAEQAIDMAAVEAAVGHVVGFMTGSAVSAAIALGERLGLYRALSAGPSVSSASLAAAAGCNERLVREWLDCNAAAGILSYDESADQYSMTPEVAMVLANEDSPVFLAGGIGALESMYVDLPKMESAARGDGALAWGDHHESMYVGVARFFRPGYRSNLITTWIPALQGVSEVLQRGGSVADIGCGFGHSCTAMAEAFPNAVITGFDFHAPSIEEARQLVASSALSDRVSFEVSGATEYEGSFDLVCFFDCLHDMGDPVAIARHASSRLKPGGTVMLVEPFAVDGRAANIAGNPAAAFFYAASTFMCTPSSLAQPGRKAMGAQSGEAGMRAVFEEAGFSHFRRASSSPFNAVYEARA